MPRATDPTPPPPGMVPCVPGNMLVDGPQAAWLAVHVVPFVRASGVRGDPAGRGGDGMMVVPARIGPVEFGELGGMGCCPLPGRAGTVDAPGRRDVGARKPTLAD